MKNKTRLRVLLPIFGACVILGGTALAKSPVTIFVNGSPLNQANEAKFENGRVVAPVRAVAEAIGSRVDWDAKTQSVNIQTEIRKDEVEQWIRQQGKEKDDYYFDGLSVEEVKDDLNHESFVFAKIDGAVHLGNFFVFHEQANDSYQLIYEQPWRVESWGIKNFSVDGVEIPMYKLTTRSGGTGVDVREAHLMFMNERGQWIESWSGTLKDRSIFQNKQHLIMGGYQLNDDQGQLYYWQTEKTISLENNKQIGEARTTTNVYEFKQGRFVEMN
ncbi:hypothetical protein BEP19_02675 [Ammoniphilus oxalaticus]|uniref:Copper amine oxidase-like N-terminal domain-containing protein n=1 Tax=Ammoniphilus oxalaticus TaxID=66863 RepID=A0A419SNH3_9BACL|nr:stalk domain-containing protein [Ammoniphilus oxalaticus]RKD25854.1 hypothetical protein BEP19_02675 [Ammoniphilus oxalaticus]